MDIAGLTEGIQIISFVIIRLSLVGLNLLYHHVYLLLNFFDLLEFPISFKFDVFLSKRSNFILMLLDPHLLHSDVQL